MKNGASLRGHKPLDTYGLTDTRFGGVLKSRSYRHETTSNFKQEFPPGRPPCFSSQSLDTYARRHPLLEIPSNWLTEMNRCHVITL